MKKDHQIISKELNLYHIQKESPGMIFWHHDGFIIFRELKNFIRKYLYIYKYKEVKTPLILDKILWKKTGHWKYYSKNMFNISFKNKEYCIKPMNCPGHVQIFKQGLKSYRDLPFRIAEFGDCYRNEPSGSLYGLMRTRGFTQDDGHIFCTKDQIESEISNCIKMIYEIYNILGFKKINVNISTRPKNRIGNDSIWDKAELDLINALKSNNINFFYKKGDGAFYGPKIEFILLDSLNRKWQCGTLQLDFSLPKLLNCFYINKNNKKDIPVIIHRAILGSIERFIGILTEEFSGYYPIWLSPIHVVIINITHNQINYVNNIMKILLFYNIRVKLDIRNEKISFKIREHTLKKIPYIIICGDKEVKLNNISVRTRYGKNLGQYNINDFITKINNEICNRCIY